MTGHETVLITGATGTVGRALLRELAGRPALSVRALSRNPNADLPGDVELWVGDFDDEASLDRAMAGVSRLFLLTAGTPIAEHDRVAVQRAQRAGLDHIVKLSALGVGRGGTDPITTWHRSGESDVRASGLAWTVLRPTAFMTNALNWSYAIRAGGDVSAPFAAGRTTLIDPRDVARVAAAALTQDGHYGQTYELTGPEALRPADQVRTLSDVLGLNINFTELEQDAARSQLERYGMPHELADAVIQLLATAREPWNALPQPTVERLLGRPPTTFRQWAVEHRAAFTP